MDNRSQVILKAVDQLPTGKLLLVNPPADGLAQMLAAERQVAVFTQDFVTAQFYQSSTMACTFGVLPETGSVFDAAIIFAPKEKQRLALLLAALAPQIRHIFLVGELKGGVKSAAKLASDFGAVEKILSARHCACYRLQSDVNLYTFSTEALLQNSQKHFILGNESETNQQPLSVISYPGVFNHGSLDAGTAFFLEHLPALRNKKIVDVGCGAGVITAYASQQGAATVTAVDTNALALAATRATLAKNALVAEVVPSNMLAQLTASVLPRDRYNLILSNPPFHQGLHTDLQPAAALIANALHYLAPGGELWLVANRYLPYENWLRKTFSRVEIMAQNGRYKIIKSAK